MQDADNQMGSYCKVKNRGLFHDYFVFYTLMFICVISCETACKFNLDLNYIVFTEKKINSFI